MNQYLLMNAYTAIDQYLLMLAGDVTEGHAIKQSDILHILELANQHAHEFHGAMVAIHA